MENRATARVVQAVIAAIFAAPLVSRAGDIVSSPVVINPGSVREGECMRGWRSSFSMRHIREWGRARGLHVVDDRGPVVDGTAAFVSPGGSSIVVSGLSRVKRYRVWIDFVRFRDARQCPPALLRIYASVPRGGPIILRELRQEDLGEGYCSIELPAETMVRGTAEILFTEYSHRPGLWGVWDIIIAEGDLLPARSDIRDDQVIDLEIKDRIIE